VAYFQDFTGVLLLQLRAAQGAGRFVGHERVRPAHVPAGSRGFRSTRTENRESLMMA
jgi:hypothetical protein